MNTLKAFFNDLKDGQTLLIDNETLMSAMHRPLQILDIRAKDVYDAGHIPGARHCAWEDVGHLIEGGQLDKDLPVIVACYTGQSSMQAATLLKLSGYDAFSLLDGMASWLGEVQQG